jgi:mycoredoxin
MPIGVERGDPITVYGTTWCKDCHLAKAVLRLNGADYRWVDIDRDPPAVEVVLRLNQGRKTVPTIVFPDGRVLIEPSRRELEAALVPPPESPTAA